MSQINPEIFRSYDVRGIYPTELDEAAAYAIGRAFARRTKATEIVVGRDMRLSSPQLHAALIEGIVTEGANVIDIGLVSIDAVYFAVRVKGLPAGIMVTASHNPKEHNGFKMTFGKTGWLRGVEFKDDVLSLPPEEGKAKGAVREFDIMDEYIAHVLSFVDTSKVKPFRVVVDAGNGMAGKIVPLLQKHLPITVIPLNFELDGNFPAHPSNPLEPQSQVQISQAVVKQGADFGVIFDGDTDRLFFVDELGRFIKADVTLPILAKEFLRREPGKGIAYNVVCSRIVPEKITQYGGVPIRTKVGFVNVSAGMVEHDGIMGGEISAHYCFRDNGYADSGFISWMILLELISKENKKLSDIVAEFMQYEKEEINIPMEFENRARAIDALKQKYADGKQDELDGVTVEYPDWWFNVRLSNTEPLLRLTIEGNAKAILEKNKKEILDFIAAQA